MLDLNDAEPQISSDLIPDGSFVKALLNLRPGGVDGMTPLDARLLKKSAQPGSDVLLLDCEFTVVEGPHAKRKFWQAFTVYGGKPDDKGISMGWQISKRTIRGIIESAQGIDPKDERPEAKARRALPGLKALDGLVFIAKVRIETQRDGQGEQNRLDIAVTPDQPEWAKVMKGEAVPPRPGARRAPKPAAGAAPGAGTPLWQAQSPTTPSGGVTPPWQPQKPVPQPQSPPQPQAPAPHWQPDRLLGGAAPQQRPGPAWLND